MHGLSPGPRHVQWGAAAPRLVALDVDGTLVGPDGDVSDAVVAACAEARDAGLHVGLATGRMRQGVDAVLRRTGLVGPHVFFNGAEVRLDDEVVHAAPVDPAAARGVVAGAQQRGIYVEVYLDDGYAITQDDERASVHWQLLGLDPRAVLAGPDDLDDLTSRVPKVTAIAFTAEEVDPILALLDEHGLVGGPAGSPATPHLRYVNGTSPQADKGRALLAAADVLGIDVARVMAVGDAPNDLPLLRTAGTAVAMGQAEDEVRGAAHLIAPPVTRDGAAVAIRAAVAGFADAPDPAA